MRCDSTINKSPLAKNVNPLGFPTRASRAGPPSPVEEYIPSPATVSMIPENASTRRMRLFTASAMYRLPMESMAMVLGKRSIALVADPPSPE